MTNIYGGGIGAGAEDTVCFGEFELDLLTQTLSRGGVRAKLQPQPFQVLELLVQRAPAIVSREEIRLHIWGNNVYIDVTQNINFCIRQIRLALGDTSSAPRFLETLPRQGYRFIAPIQKVAVDASLREVEPKPAATPGVSPRRWLLPGLAAFVLFATGVAWWTWLHRSTGAGVAEITSVTTFAGDEREPSLSPDGLRVAFSWEGDNGENRDIYVLSPGEPSPLRLTSDPANDGFPSWSPDGKNIAFIRRRDGVRADVMIVPASGGAQRKVREIRLSPLIASRALAWTPDGKWLCFTDEVGASGNHALFLLSPDSNSVRRLLPEEENGIGDSSPAFSPDGRWLAFARFHHPFNSSLLVQRLSPDFKPLGPPTVVKDAGLNPKAPVWMPDGEKILFLDGSRIMETEIGGPARSFYVSPLAFSELTIAGPSRRLVACLQNVRNEIWSIPLEAKGLKARGSAQPILQSSASQWQPRFSPDGRLLAFASARSGSSEVWLAEADGRNPRQLTHMGFYIAGYIRWSPDGQFLTFHGRLPSEPQLYIVSVANGALRQVTHRLPGFMGPSWSMDGQSLYGDSLENGKNQTYRVTIAGDSPRLLFEGGAAIEVPRRNLLIYEKEDQPGIYCRSLVGDLTKSPERLLTADYQPALGGFYAFEDGFYYVGVAPTGIPRAFRFYNFDAGASVDVLPSPANLDLGLTVSPDRTRLDYCTKSQGSEDLVQIGLK